MREGEDERTRLAAADTLLRLSGAGGNGKAGDDGKLKPGDRVFVTWGDGSV